MNFLVSCQRPPTRCPAISRTRECDHLFRDCCCHRCKSDFVDAAERSATENLYRKYLDQAELCNLSFGLWKVVSVLEKGDWNRHQTRWRRCSHADLYIKLATVEQQQEIRNAAIADLKMAISLYRKVPNTTSNKFARKKPYWSICQLDYPFMVEARR